MERPRPVPCSPAPTPPFVRWTKRARRSSAAPTAGVSLRIVGDDGVTLGEGEAGHVEAFAPQTLFAGYWKEPELSRDCMTADGWYKTGDLGAINDGGFSFRGRAKQTLVVSGRKFSLDDIDACLQSDADVGRQTVSFVFRGGADATDGLGVAVAISEGEALDSVSTDWIRNALVRRYGLAPAVLLPVRSGEWPLTATGKVDRRALAERAAKAGAEIERGNRVPRAGKRRRRDPGFALARGVEPRARIRPQRPQAFRLRRRFRPRRQLFRLRRRFPARGRPVDQRRQAVQTPIRAS